MSNQSTFYTYIPCMSLRRNLTPPSSVLGPIAFFPQVHLHKQPKILLVAQAVMPRARPPIESYQEILHSGILDNIGKKRRTVLCADGCKSWKKAADRMGLPCIQVSHTDREFCKDLAGISTVPPLCSKLAGTQCLDADWGSLKRFLTAKANRTYRDKSGAKGPSETLTRRILQFVFRRSWEGDTPSLLLQNVLAALT